MDHEPDADLRFDQLRRLVARDPKQARIEFTGLISQGGDLLDKVLERASRAGEGRVRQMIATGVRLCGQAGVIESWLRRWLEVEGDEFTRKAIESALERDRRPTTTTTPPARNQPPHFLETYRYVADRLCHRIRNSLARPGAQFIRLEQCIGRIDDPAVRADLIEALGVLRTGFQRVARSVEFDIGDDYLQWQDIVISQWIERAAVDFAARFGPARLAVAGPPDALRCTIRATRFHLETAFGNLWANALQAVESPAGCEITASLSLTSDGRTLQILISDNGPGFTEKHLETAFQQTFSTKSTTRGRGLMEIADAILQMQGNVQLHEVRSGDYRIRITLPARGA